MPEDKLSTSSASPVDGSATPSGSNDSNTPSTPPADGKSKSGQWIGIGVLVLAVAGGGWYAMSQQTKPAAKKAVNVKIGFMAPLTGDSANGGLAAQQGLDLAKQTLHDENVTVTLIKKSTNCDAASGEKAMKELADEGVVAVIGELCSGGTLAAAPVANERHIPVVSMSSTNPKVTDAGDYVFRTVPSDALQADFTAKYFYDKLAVRKLAILNTDEAYAQGLNDGVTEAFKKLGGEVVSSEKVAKGATDVAAPLQRVKAAGAQALYVPTSSFATMVATLIKKKELALTVPVLSSEASKDRNVINDAGAAGEGFLVVGINEGTSAYYEQTQAAYKVDPAIYSAQTYDAYQAIFKALQGGASTGEAIKTALYASDFKGVSGDIKFDANGDVAGNYGVYKVVSGKFVAQ